MTDSRALAGMDRLPWLPDEPKPAAKPRGGRDLVGWAIAATVVVAGASYWLGTRTSPEPRSETAAPGRPTVTAPLPAPRAAQRTEIEFPPAPEVRAVPSSPITSPAPVVERPSERFVPVRVHHRAPARTAPKRVARQASRPAPAPVARTVPTQNVRLWPARQSAGAYGRVVQIGAFGTRLQAKRGWWYMARAYPGVRRLPAVVVESRNSHGRPFYRFQIGTTSQAHSEVLCQRMERIRFSCAVVGLPWKPKVER